MTFLWIVVGCLVLTGLAYMFATERNNIVLNIIMYVIGIIVPSIIVSFGLLTEDYILFGGLILGILCSIPWWGYLIAIIVQLFCSAYLMFVSGEKMEEVFDDYGNKIGWKGGQMGLVFLTLVLTFALIFALICAIKGLWL